MKNKAFEFRIYPNKEQKILLARTFGCTRLVFNHFLALRKERYEESRETVSYYQCTKELTRLKKERTFLKEVDSVALQQSLRHLDTAFDRFFKGDSKYPKFKCKHKGKKTYSSICINNNIRLENGKIRLPKLGPVKIKQHRPVPCDWTLRSVTVKQVPSGKYFVSILFEYESQVREKKPEKVIGLDYSMPKLYVSSEGEKIEYPHYYRRTEERLAKEQRALSRMEKGSRNYIKQRIKIAKLHEKIANRRKDFLHKESYRIAESYDAVCIEDLDMKGMSQALNFGKSVHDNGWGMFREMLRYKLEDRGKRLIVTDKWFPSSQICSECGSIHPEVKDLSVKEWFCDCCLTYHDRDENAAKNIKREGMRQLSA